jgi:hypothetical protein
MPPAAPAPAPAPPNAANRLASLPDELRARIFALLPPGDEILTVPRICKALAAATAPRVARLRQELMEKSMIARQRAWTPSIELFSTSLGVLPDIDIELFAIPLWALQEAWPQLRDCDRFVAVLRAAFHGDSAALTWALPQSPKSNRAHECMAAAAGGQLEALQCVLALGFPLPEDICDMAVKGGHLAVLQWLRAQEPPCPWGQFTCASAAGCGDLAVLQWLRAQEPPCPWDEDTCGQAAEFGGLGVLQWLRAQQPPCPWNEETCAAAARNGDLAMLQWARAQDPPCPWNEETCAAAARNGDLAMLQWLRAQEPPCPWSEDTCGQAAEFGGLGVLQWLRAQQPPCPWNVETCAAAARTDDWEMLRWLRAQEPPCPWDEETCMCRSVGPSVRQSIRPMVRPLRRLLPVAAVGARPGAALPMGRAAVLGGDARP